MCLDFSKSGSTLLFVSSALCMMCGGGGGGVECIRDQGEEAKHTRSETYVTTAGYILMLLYGPLTRRCISFHFIHML